MNDSFDRHHIHITDTVLMTLGYCSVEMEKEAELSESDLDTIRRQIDELIKRILDSTELKDILKRWMLDLLRIIRDGVDRYNIRGARGLRRSFQTMIGDLQDHYAEVEKIKEEEPALFGELGQLIDALNKLSARAMKYEPLIETVKPLLPFFAD